MAPSCETRNRKSCLCTNAYRIQVYFRIFEKHAYQTCMLSPCTSINRVFTEIYIPIVPMVDVCERGGLASYTTMHGAYRDTRHTIRVCAPSTHRERTYRSLWHNKSEGAEYNAASCAQWPPWKLWNVPPILPSHSIQPGEDSRGVRRRKHFSRLLILKISEPVRDDRS